MKHVFVKKLPKEVTFTGWDWNNRDHYRKGKYEYVVIDKEHIYRFKRK